MQWVGPKCLHSKWDDTFYLLIVTTFTLLFVIGYCLCCHNDLCILYCFSMLLWHNHLQVNVSRSLITGCILLHFKPLWKDHSWTTCENSPQNQAYIKPNCNLYRVIINKRWMDHLELDGKLNTEVKENTESHLLHLHSDLKKYEQVRKNWTKHTTSHTCDG